MLVSALVGRDGPGPVRSTARAVRPGPPTEEPVSARPRQPEPFVRGCVFPAAGPVAYPRLCPTDADQLPGDVWSSAAVPALVRLELIGDASAVRVRYRTTTANLGYRGDGAGCSFAVFRSGRQISEEPAVLGDGEVVLALPGDPDQPAIIHLPEGMRPVVLAVEAVGGSLRPAPRQPRCLVIGDAVTQGWLASSPAMSWPAVVGRKHGLDMVDFACAGTTRLETVVAQSVAATPAEALVLSVGTGCWGRPPHSVALLAEELRTFLELVRAGHPDVPLAVVSPILRPSAEDVPNVFGATLAELRRAVEDVVVDLTAADRQLALVPGEPVLTADELADGIYPTDEGHRRLAAAVAKVLAPRATSLRQAALARWQEEMMAATPAFAGQLSTRPRVTGGGPPADRPDRQRGIEATGHRAPGAMPAGIGGASTGAASRELTTVAVYGPAEPSGDANAPAGAPASRSHEASDGAGVADDPTDGVPVDGPVPEAVVAAARASAAAARAYEATTGRVVVAATK